MDPNLLNGLWYLERIAIALEKIQATLEEEDN